MDFFFSFHEGHESWFIQRGTLDAAEKLEKIRGRRVNTGSSQKKYQSNNFLEILFCDPQF